MLPRAGKGGLTRWERSPSCHRAVQSPDAGTGPGCMVLDTWYCFGTCFIWRVNQYIKINDLGDE